MALSYRVAGPIGFVCLLFVSLARPVAAFQDSETNAYASTQSTRSVWEFGVKIKAEGDVEKVVASFPLPIDWPEQSVAIQNVDKSAHFVKQSEKDLDTAQLIVAQFGPMSPGEEAHLLITMTIDKRNIQAPTSTDLFRMAEKTRNKVRKYLLSSPQIESGDKAIRKLAEELDIDSSAPAWQQVESIFRWVRDNIEYRFEETNRSCLEALASREGDCGEMTALFIAICRARGIPARAVWIPQHTYPEFYLEDDQGNGHWFPCQVAGPYEFGGMTESFPILQKGDNFKLPGLPRARRFVQPTLSATGGPVRLESIMRRVDQPTDQSGTLPDTAARRVEEDK